MGHDGSLNTMKINNATNLGICIIFSESCCVVKHMLAHHSVGVCIWGALIYSGNLIEITLNFALAYPCLKKKWSDTLFSLYEISKHCYLVFTHFFYSKKLITVG